MHYPLRRQEGKSASLGYQLLSAPETKPTDARQSQAEDTALGWILH